ncbi:MAG: hypothetical protein U0263_17315 [Polyangiaceae bacterium]
MNDPVLVGVLHREAHRLKGGEELVSGARGPFCQHCAEGFALDLRNGSCSFPLSGCTTKSWDGHHPGMIERGLYRASRKKRWRRRLLSGRSCLAATLRSRR